MSILLLFLALFNSQQKFLKIKFGFAFDILDRQESKIESDEHAESLNHKFVLAITSFWFLSTQFHTEIMWPFYRVLPLSPRVATFYCILLTYYK